MYLNLSRDRGISSRRELMAQGVLNQRKAIADSIARKRLTVQTINTFLRRLPDVRRIDVIIPSAYAVIPACHLVRRVGIIKRLPLSAYVNCVAMFCTARDRVAVCCTNTWV